MRQRTQCSWASLHSEEEHVKVIQMTAPLGEMILLAKKHVCTRVRPVCLLATHCPYTLIAFWPTLFWENYSYVCFFFLFPLPSPAPSFISGRPSSRFSLLSVSLDTVATILIFLNPVSTGSHSVLHRNLPSSLMPTGWSTNPGLYYSNLDVLSSVLEPCI